MTPCAPAPPASSPPSTSRPARSSGSLPRRHRAIEFRKFLAEARPRVTRRARSSPDPRQFLDPQDPGHQELAHRAPPLLPPLHPDLEVLVAEPVERWFGELTGRSSAAVLTDRSGPSTPTSAPRSTHGTTNPDPSSGPSPPTRSSIRSPPTADESTTRDTRTARSAGHEPLARWSALYPQRQFQGFRPGSEVGMTSSTRISPARRRGCRPRGCARRAGCGTTSGSGATKLPPPPTACRIAPRPPRSAIDQPGRKIDLRRREDRGDGDDRREALSEPRHTAATPAKGLGRASAASRRTQGEKNGARAAGEQDGGVAAAGSSLMARACTTLGVAFAPGLPRARGRGFGAPDDATLTMGAPAGRDGLEAAGCDRRDLPEHLPAQQDCASSEQKTSRTSPASPAELTRHSHPSPAGHTKHIHPSATRGSPYAWKDPLTSTFPYGASAWHGDSTRAADLI